MKKELNELELEQVTGGTVKINGNQMVVGFSTTKEAYRLSGCTYTEASFVANTLLDENPNLTNADFDTLVKNEFKSRGWI